MDDREIHIDLHLKIIANKGIREGNGTPLQYSCLENPMDGGACMDGGAWLQSMESQSGT